MIAPVFDKAILSLIDGRVGLENSIHVSGMFDYLLENQLFFHINKAVMPTKDNGFSGEERLYKFIKDGQFFMYFLLQVNVATKTI